MRTEDLLVICGLKYTVLIITMMIPGRVYSIDRLMHMKLQD